MGRTHHCGPLGDRAWRATASRFIGARFASSGFCAGNATSPLVSLINRGRALTAPVAAVADVPEKRLEVAQPTAGCICRYGLGDRTRSSG